MSFAEQAAQLEVEVNYLRIQVDSLTKSNKILMEHNQRMEGDILVLANERDTANRKRDEIKELLDGAARLIVDGINKSRSDNNVRQVVERRQMGNSAEMLEAPSFLKGAGQ